MEDDQKLKVIIVEDDARYRTALSELINASTETECMADFGSAEELLGYLKINSCPDILLLDINLPGISGLEALDKIFLIYPDIKILILTIMDDQDSIYAAFKNGVRGYLVKTASQFEIVDTIEKVSRGYVIYSVDIALNIIRDFEKQASAPEQQHPSAFSLTKREMEVLTLLSHGFKNQKIAEKMFLSVNAIESHLTHIYQKLNAKNRSQAINIAFNSGLVGKLNNAGDTSGNHISRIFLFDKKGSPCRGKEVSMVIPGTDIETTEIKKTDIYGKAVIKHRNSGMARVTVNGQQAGEYEVPGDFAIILQK